MKTEKHDAVTQYSDMMRCAKCRRVWDTNDDEPPCVEEDGTRDSAESRASRADDILARAGFGKGEAPKR